MLGTQHKGEWTSNQALTGFSGADIKGLLNSNVVAEIQALKRYGDKISLIFIQFDRDAYLESGGAKYPRELSPIDISIAFFEDPSVPKPGTLHIYSINNVKLQRIRWQSGKIESPITSDDLVAGELTEGIILNPPARPLDLLIKALGG